MLLTLAASSIAHRLKPAKGPSARPPSPGARAPASPPPAAAPPASAGAPAPIALTDLPAFTREYLGLHGLAMSTPLLAGVDRPGLTRLFEAADKAGCPCLILIEPAALALADPRRGEAAAQRAGSVVEAASLLGCNAAAFGVEAPDDEEAMIDVADRLRPVLRRAEKLEINLCISSGQGLTASPDRLTELLKKIGGFRVGTLPDFESAHASGDGSGYLRRLVPYASTVLAVAQSFPAAKARGEPAHAPWDLPAFVQTVASVGYEGPLAIDYRGPGDTVEGLIKARDMIQALVGEAEDAP